MEKKTTKKTTKKTVKKVTKTPVKKTTTKNIKKKNGFTLIELLAVIIILGILMIIAIPSVTKYISDSRKSAYVDTAKNIISGARAEVNKGDLEMYDTGATYYIPVEYFKSENGLKSPYGDFTQAYVAVTYDGNGYNYYWVSNDEAGEGVNKVVLNDLLDEDDIVSDIKDEDIEHLVKTTAIGGRERILIYDIETGRWVEPGEVVQNIISDTGAPVVCKRANTLHTATCTATSGGCYGDGYYEGNKGTTITYGTIPTGNKKPGDAYDCKVKKDGGYTERFYYVNTYGNYSEFIYYKNTTSGQTGVAWNAESALINGPVTAAQYLPTKFEWDNPAIPVSFYMRMVGENNETITSYFYSTQAAILPFTTSIMAACGTNVFRDVYGSPNNKLGKCNFLLENLGGYETNNDMSQGYWLFSVRDDVNSAYTVVSKSGYISYTTITNARLGVRPYLRIPTTTVAW